MQGKLQAMSCNSFNDAVGAGARFQGTIVVSDSSIRDSRHAGFMVCHNSTAELKKCSVNNNSTCGAIVEDSGSFAELHDCTFDGCCKITGVHISEQARAVVEDYTIRGCKKGHGVLATDRGSKVAGKGCSFANCAQSAVCACEGAFAEAFDSSSTSYPGAGY